MPSLLVGVNRAPTAPGGGTAKILLVPMESYGYSDLNGSGSAPYINSLFANYAYASDVLSLGHYSASSYTCLYSGIDCHSPDLPPNVYGGTPNPDYNSTIVGDGTDGSTFNSRTTIFDLLHTAGKIYAGYYDNTYAAYRSVLATFPRLTGSPVSLPVLNASSGNVTGAGTLANIVAADLDSRLPDFAFAQASNAHNMHDSGIGSGDTWLAGAIPAWQATSWYTAHGGTIMIWWDEQDGYGGDSPTAPWVQIGSSIYGGAGGTMATIVVSLAAAGKGNYSTASCTAGVLGSITDALGLARLGTSVGAPNIPLYTSSGGGAPVPYDPHGVIGSVPALSFQDEFSGSSIDLAKWVNGDWYGSNMNNVAIIPATVAGGYALFTLPDSGHGSLIHTGGSGGNFSFHTGYVEARINFPGPDNNHSYNWPAWWTTGIPADGSWPAGGENDIAEGDGTSLMINYHGPGSSSTNGPDPGPAGFTNGFHVFGLHRKVGSCDVIWDGVIQRTYATADGEALQELVMNVGNGNTAMYGAGSTIQVDYVRAWTN
jgi:Phosphoesterase family